MINKKIKLIFFIRLIDYQNVVSCSPNISFQISIYCSLEDDILED